MKKPLFSSLGLIALLTLSGCGDTQEETPAMPEAPAPAASQTASPTPSASIEKTEEPDIGVPADPTASAQKAPKTISINSPYRTPKGTTEFTVDFTLLGDTITAFSVKGNQEHTGSIKHQGLFYEGAKQFIIGKSLSEIENFPAIVNGSSLTPGGFNAALAQLKEQM